MGEGVAMVKFFNGFMKMDRSFKDVALRSDGINVIYVYQRT